MTKALHVICKREGGGLKGVSLKDREQAIYISRSWGQLGGDPQELVGGRFYLHSTQAEKSSFGGTVLKVEHIDCCEEDGLNNRYDITFKADKIGRDKPWSGRTGRTATSGIIDAN